MFTFASLPNIHGRRIALLSCPGDKAARVEAVTGDEWKGRSQDIYKQKKLPPLFGGSNTCVYVIASAGVYCLDLAFYSLFLCA